jgi:hypothetical protein
MMKRLACAATAISLIAPPLSAQSTVSGTTHNVQCLIAVAELASSSDATTKSAGLLASVFFAGQVFGGNPAIDLTAAVKAEASKLTPEDIQGLQVRCGAEMKARGQQISAASAALLVKDASHNPS